MSTISIAERRPLADEPPPPSRRAFLAYFGAAGLGATALPELLWAQQTTERAISRDDLIHAEKLAGIELTDDERDLMLEDLEELRQSYAALQQVPLPNSVAPALVFDPLLTLKPPVVFEPPPEDSPRVEPPPAPPWEKAPADEELPFLTLTRLGALLRAQQLSSVELTRLYLDRLKELGPDLECVITVTEERALSEAERADRDFVAGRDRGPLHGIPWGAKDLLAARGYPTTWGARPYRDQTFAEDAAVVEKLTTAGAVLCAKLTLGALAWGDVWFGGQTRNPWKPEQGSSGSSAGSAAATAAGLVGFSIGSETWGSIISPCTVCGATGLRPTFGRVSRHGAMTLSWSMDKLGPICRSVEDCALVLAAIDGIDPRDPATVAYPFQPRPHLDPRKLRVGYLRSAFEEEREDAAWRAFDLETLEQLTELELDLRPIELPDLPVDSLAFILSAEAAAAFDELTRSGRDDELTRQVRNAWPNVFRQSHFIPAVDYIQANRVRTLLIQQMAELMATIDVYVAPTFGGSNLLLTNLTGHPAIVLPNGFREDGTPTSITFTGRLFGEAELIAVARSYQEATDFHLQHPVLEAVPA